MTAPLLIGFFFFILAAVAAAGYVFVLRPSRIEGAEVPAPLVLGRDMPTAQAAVADMFRLIGEAIPGRGTHHAAQQKLIAAGFRWPSAVQIFLGIKCARALMLGVGVRMGSGDASG